MMKVSSITIAVLVPVTLAGCATSLPGVPGAGGSVNSSLVAALSPGLIGSLGIESLRDGDRKRALEAEYRALEYSTSGEPVNWENGWSGNRGVVVAAQPYRVGAQDCRPYSHTVNIGGKAETARGTACRNADGSWTAL